MKSVQYVVRNYKGLKNPKAIVLLCHNYLEFMMDTILSVYFIGIRVSEYMVKTIDNNTEKFQEEILGSINFRRKIEILFVLKLIPKDLHDELNEVNTIRNKVAHDFEYNFPLNNAEQYNDKCVKLYENLSERYRALIQKKEVKEYRLKVEV